MVGAKGVSSEAREMSAVALHGRAYADRYYGTPDGEMDNASQATPRRSGRSERRSACERMRSTMIWLYVQKTSARCQRCCQAPGAGIEGSGGELGDQDVSFADCTSARCLRAHSAGVLRRLHRAVPKARAVLYEQERCRCTAAFSSA